MYIQETHLLQGQPLGDKNGSIIVLNYTLVMDSAPGPSVNQKELLLSVKPNPTVIEVQEGSRIFHVGSMDTLSIIVRHLFCVIGARRLVCIRLKLSERRALSPDPRDEARSCHWHCCLNRSATVRQKV